MLPTFQPQNPAISGYYLGWASCTGFAGAMCASYDRQVAKLVSGGTLRRWTGDTVGGLTLAQIDSALNTHTSVRLETFYRLPWTDFIDRIDSGEGAVLQGWYAPIAQTGFDAGDGFIGNHALFVPPRYKVMDPLADGRRPGIYQYHGETYPKDLLREFAGDLNIGVGRIARLGQGRVYASFSQRIATVPGTIPPPTGPQIVASAPTPSERNVMITQGGLVNTHSHVKTLAKGQPLFRSPGGPRVTAMSATRPVDYEGGAGKGWHAVQVMTAVPYADGLLRPTILYVPAAAGPVTKKV